MFWKVISMKLKILIYIYIYYLSTAIGLTPGGSGTVHTMQVFKNVFKRVNTTQKSMIETITVNMELREECRLSPLLFNIHLSRTLNKMSEN